MHTNKRKPSRVLLLMVALSLTLSAACATDSPCECRSHAPRPSEAEIADYARIISEDVERRQPMIDAGEIAPMRPAVAWVGRMIGYLWPEETEAARRGAESR